MTLDKGPDGRTPFSPPHGFYEPLTGFLSNIIASTLCRKIRSLHCIFIPLAVLFCLGSSWVLAQGIGEDGKRSQEPVVSSPGSPTTRPPWQYGIYLDLGYLLDFNFPDNHLWRSKTSTTRVNDPTSNMALGYVQKVATPDSRWGLEFGLQGGRDTKDLIPGPLPGDNRPIGGADTLRHFYRANLSYLAPIGNGLTLTGGLFDSYIGYESFLAKNNLTYTRSYIADQSPYFMFGVAAAYPVNEKWDLGLYSINGFSYLAEPNDVFSYGAKLVWRPIANLAVTQNLYYGPDQDETAFEFWRLFSDSIIEWKGTEGTLALIFNVGTEKQADTPSIPGTPRFVWMGSALEAGWHIGGPWSMAFRPEFYWDPSGLITGQEQLIRAVTTTLEYKFRILSSIDSLFRLEYRFDESTGSGGGFFKGGARSPGVSGLTPSQHLLIFGFMWWFDYEK